MKKAPNGNTYRLTKNNTKKNIKLENARLWWNTWLLVQEIHLHSRNTSTRKEQMPTRRASTWVDDKRKGYINLKGPNQKNCSKQLQTHNLPTNDVENTNSTNKGKDLLFAKKPWIVSWRTGRTPQRIQKHSRITLHRSIHPKWEQDKTSYGLDWLQKGIWYGSTKLDTTLSQNVQDITRSHKLHRKEHANLESGTDSRRKKLGWNKDPKRWSCKYLSILEADTIKQVEMKDNIRKEYLRRTRKQLETKLASRNLIKGINTWAVPLVRYSGPFLKWTREELKQMDQRTRKLMTMHKALHTIADADRLYVSRKVEGRGLACIEDSVDASIQRLEDYTEKHERGLITTIRADTDNMINERMTTTKKRKWEGKQLYGPFKRLINNISHQKTWTWLRKGNLKRETESLLIAAQDNAIRTNHIKARIDKTQQNSKCRLCSDRDETINHIISECSKLAAKEYKARHDWVGKVIHWEMCRKFQFDHANKWYMHNPPPFLENDSRKHLLDFNIQTDPLIPASRPDLIIINKRKRISKIVDFAVPADHRINLKEIEKKDKYLDLASELKKLWNMK